MNYREFGQGHPETIILLHGGGLSWWNFREEAEMLRADHHLILPVLDGHAESGRPFTTIEDNAAEIISFIDRELGGSVLLIGGLSLGGQILLEMLAQRSDICRYALVESAMVIPSKVTNALIGPAFGSSYGLIRSRSFAKMQFKSLRIRQELFEDYYRDTCLIKKADMIAFMKANTAYRLKESISGCLAETYVFAGEKETRGIIRSAEQICSKIPGSTRTIMPGLYHGEFSINHPADYVRTLKEVISR